MKIFQILNGICHWDATETVQTLDEAAARFSPEMQFAAAPDTVFEGWGFDGTAEGDARFVKPIPPEGWLYDDATGTFYREGDTPASEQGDIWDELAAAYAKGVNEA